MSNEDPTRDLAQDLGYDEDGSTPSERMLEAAELDAQEGDQEGDQEDAGAPDDRLGDLLMEGAMVIVDLSAIVDGSSYPLQGVIEHLDRGKGYLILKQTREGSAETRRVLIPWHAINFIASGWE
jgi:hypothetical protein